MKQLNILPKFLPLLVFIAPLLLASCSEDDEIDPRLERLAGTWEVEQVLLEGFDVTVPSYENFAILFRTDGSFFSVDGDPVFTEAGGFWEFVDNGDDRIVLGEVEANLSFSENDTKLNILFFAPNEQIGVGGRITGLSGEYQFFLVSSEQDIEP
ncbi:MAG: hypothetical protein AAF789_02610 [Bacteroidota bacterium]